MISMEEIDQLKSFEARSIIEELRKGSVPIEYVPVFTVGRKNWLTFIEDDLENYIGQGGSKVRFISGDYGDGKTHFMSVIRHLAMEKGFAVSFVVLTRDVPSINLKPFTSPLSSNSREILPVWGFVICWGNGWKNWPLP